MFLTEWIFHIEDDWEFYRSSFIEKSLLIFKHSIENPNLHWPIFWVNLNQTYIIHGRLQDLI